MISIVLSMFTLTVSDFEIPESQRPYFELMRVEDAWEVIGDKAGCLIGVLDTGFDFFHPALAETLQPGFYADGVHHLGSLKLIAHGTSMASLIGASRVSEDGMCGLAPQCSMLAAAMGMPRHRLHLMRLEFRKNNPGATMQDWAKEAANRRGEMANFSRDWIDYVTRTAYEGIQYLVDHEARVINFSAYVGKRVLASFPKFERSLEEAFQ